MKNLLASRKRCTPPFPFNWGLLLAIGVLGTFLCSCQPSVGSGTPAPESTVNSFAAESVPPPVAADELQDALGETRQLVVWTPEFMSISGEGNAAQVMAAAVTQFEQNYPGVRVEFLVKAEAGEASALNYLRSAQKVAPAILPDVVLLPAEDLWLVAESGLIPPLSRAELVRMGEFYPFAEQSVTFGEQLLGIPYAADMLHLVYHGEEIDAAPQTWAELFVTEGPYLFPTASQDGYSNDSLLLQYVGAGGELLQSGEVSNPAALEAVFEYLIDGRDLGVIPAEVEQYASLTSVWDIFVAEESGMADSSAHLVLGQRDLPEGGGYGFSPTLIGEPVTIARSWAFAILTDDPAQRAQVMDLMNALLTPSVHGSWSQFSTRLPTQPAAFEVWSSGNDYYDFLRDELAPSAVGIPNGRRFADFSARLQEAQHNVLSGQSSPADAVLDVRATP